MANYTRKKGFSFLSFLLGILFGMIILVAGVAGVLYYALKTDVDKALSMVGLENKDEDGNSIYINTDVETGGAASLLDLVSKVSVLASSGAELSVSDVEGLLPAVGGLVDGLYETVNSFIPMERAELTGVKFSELSDFVQEKLFDVQPAVLLENFGMSGLVDNKLLSVIFLGPEAEYIQVDGKAYPLYYDTFYNEGALKREDDAASLPENLYGDAEEFNGAYRVYYYFDGETAYTKNSGEAYSLYTPEYASLTGYYYRNGEERVVVTPVCVRDFADGQLSMLDNVYLSDLLADGNELFDRLLGGISIGDLLNNGIDFVEILNGIYLADILPTQVDDAIMTNMFWNINSIEESAGADYTHIGTYTEGDIDYPCYIQTKLSENGDTVIDSAYYSNGGERVQIHSITVGGLMDGLNIDDVINGFTIADFIDIKAQEAVMAYLGYGLYGVTNTGENTYTAGYDVNGVKVTAYAETDGNGIITKCYYLDGEMQISIKSTGIGNISDRITNVTKKLTIGDFIGETNDPIISKLGKYTIDSVTDGISKLTVEDVMGNIDESNILIYNIKDSAIGELPQTIANLTINTLYAAEIYKNGDAKGTISLATVYNSDYLYYTLEDGKYSLVDEGHGLGKLKLSEFTPNTYYTYGAADGVWKMLVYAKTEDGGKTEMAYTVNNLTAMIENINENISNSTLYDLHNAGILQFTDVDSLNNKIPYAQGNTIAYSKPIGEMGLMEFINFVVDNISRTTASN